MNSLKEQLFPFVQPLMTELRRRGLTVVLLSGSADEIVGELARNIGAAAGYGAKLHVSNGIYSGQVSIAAGAPGWKRQMLAKFTAAYPRCDRPSYALGNSILDIEILEIAATPMVFEPDPKLYEIARLRTWPIVNRNDVVQQTIAAL